MRHNFRRALSRLAASVLLCSAAVVLIGPAPAVRADLQNPRQEFLRSSVGGLFLHWGQRTGPQHNNCAQWEAAVTNGGWDPNYWVREAEKLHLQYLVLATFHSRLGYARPYPSRIPGSCRTNRDFLGELLAATNARGMKLIYYMTDDPQWHAEGLPSGQSWLNSRAYSDFKGRSVDLHSRDGFGEFSYDQFFEIMDRYPALGGFWIDNDNAFWERRNLYRQIHDRRPSFTLSNNNEDTAEMDMISNEQKTGMTPSYDYPQKVFTAAPRLIEADFKLPSTGAWWFTGSDPAVDRKLTLGRLITNAGSSIKALMAETAQVNGRFPKNQEDFNNFTDGYLDRIWESLGGTEGGGYMFRGLKPGRWNNGAYGVTTVKKNNPDLHYIHLIDPPTSGNSLVLRDNGYAVTRVTNLRTGAIVSFSQANGNLTLNGLSNFDPFDTVFKVETNGRVAIYPPSTYTMSASGSAGGHPASAAADGNYLTFWQNNAMPASLRFNLGASRRVQYIGVNQREDSVVSGGTSKRIRDFRVFYSDDGTNWGSPVRTGTLANARGVQMIDLPARNTRHVRLEVTALHGGGSFAIDEAWIAGGYVGGPIPPPPPQEPPPPPPNRFEAENAMFSNAVVESEHAGFSGTGYVNYTNVVGGFVEWTVTRPTAGPVTLRIGYANGTLLNRPMAISVNGGAPTTANFPTTGAWTSYAVTTLPPVTLNAGTNTIRATATVAEGGPNADYIDVVS